MEKIRKTMRREDGFTLVELLAVIVILGIILAIAIPAIGGVVNRAQSQADDAERKLAIDAARLYITAGEDVTWDGTNKAEINVGDLYTKGYLETAADKNTLSGTVKVTRTLLTGSTSVYDYEYDATGVTKQ